MKISIAFLLYLFCNDQLQQAVHRFIPIEYNYPEKNIGTGKIFVYENPQTGKPTFTDISIRQSGGSNLVVQRTYDTDATGDSSVSRDGINVENYQFNLGEKALLAQKLIDTITDNGKYLGRHTIIWSVSTAHVMQLTNLQEFFLKDSTVEFDKKILPAIVIQRDLFIQVTAIEDTSQKISLNASMQYCYARGLGLFTYRISFTDHEGKWNDNRFKLTTIKELNQKPGGVDPARP